MKKFVVLFLALVSTAVVAQDRVVKFDKNQDGKVDYVELLMKCDVSKDLFVKADKNGDDVLSNGEMRTARAYLFKKCNKEVV
jgi:hypothetical protein